ncbi:MAG: FKBP-type peptidyl-prolyl cis-trans isomerase [Ignavibacteriota bacterium]|nr:FKBP-type peptidyl-prolyl cis-trans isomerase [Ignavibacteriales bacterium]MCC7092707.1 FKBP-type peptidyl-prolyl cis-trans isomerase [Ignavibacteriaceae bacterium]MEB2295849.1 FKBP-type peptidyl-prolyl cis-trans isomerase [Ignavibacteria bacterium]QKJ97784.1 MAG: FKBP-type peptidyl-prolyl cis-trans isomerase [Ignavibacteriota bacterium]MCZ7612443.1 FKBP-type peptidyl-prolyl cis-trans isomerase [Ignavibacteriaceae bacterium]
MQKILFVLIAVLTVSLVGCNKGQEIKTLESGLQFMDDSLGTGREAKAGDLVSIHFKGWMVPKDSAGELFTDWSTDQTKNMLSLGDSKMRNQPIKFVLNSGSFIKGTDEGIIGMKAGGVRTMIIPSKLAYGEAGVGFIPPNTDLKVVIELLDVKDKGVAKMWEVDSTLFKTTASGLKYAIISHGDGPMIDSGKVVTVNYSGYLQDGTLFDSSVERDEPIQFVVGQGQVIPGWDEGMRLLKKGDKARFIIPPQLGYGEMQLEKIPANSTLIFDTEIVDVK